jgi:hypothetical protein
MLFLDGQAQALREGLLFVGHAAKQHDAPEVVHHRQVLLPVYPGKMVEHWRKQLILVHVIVKGVYEQFNVCLCFYLSLYPGYDF